MAGGGGEEQTSSGAGESCGGRDVISVARVSCHGHLLEAIIFEKEKDPRVPYSVPVLRER